LRVKVCGITNLEDALVCVENGVDALGFVFYERSPRYISPLNARKIIEQLPPFVERVGLFVNTDAKELDEIAQISQISLAQIHFEADSDFYKQLKTPHIKVVRAKKRADLLKYSDEYRFVDSFVQSYGGEGKRLPLEWFEDVDCSKMIIAGGIDEKNVQELHKFGFYGVDLSSSLEESKGKKDRMKIENFMKAINLDTI
jgi:phosphoribosylanthranilate isomerase